MMVRSAHLRRHFGPHARRDSMKRWIVPTALPAALLLALLVDRGQAQEQEERFVEIDTLNVRDTLYHLGEGGANGLALIDEINGGVILVGTKLPGWGQPVIDAVYQVTDLPVTTIINTHSDRDHTGANSEFPDVTEIIAHENTAANMARMDLFAGSAAGLPNTTFTDHFGLLEDLDRIELYYFGPAHSDGDIVVVFPQKRTAYLGELFPDKAAPVIDTANGGSGIAFPETLAKVVEAIDGVDRVITAHAPIPTTYAGRGRRDRGERRAWTGWLTWDDLREYADFNRDFLTAVRASHEAGRSVDEAAANLDLPERYADYGMEQARANVEAIYAELEGR
ncbi:MAG: MBL fold metallo-hydrolase [Acidobacteria bacterium]|nr:MBL fold metallo-hydrolase [Acidobacteriota bacterium]